MSEHVTHELLKGFLEAFNLHDLDAIMSYFADDCVFYMPRGARLRGDQYIGKDAVRAGLEKRFEGIQMCITETISIGSAIISESLNGHLQAHLYQGSISKCEGLTCLNSPPRGRSSARILSGKYLSEQKKPLPRITRIFASWFLKIV